MHDDLKLLVEWSSPWEEFVTAIRPALGKSPEPLEAEAHTGLFPYRGMAVSLVAEFLLLLAIIILPSKLSRIRPFEPTAPPKYDVIYFSGKELPRTEDAGGARSGGSGRSGGREGHNATQVIRVARGPSLKEQVVDAPKLNLPNSTSAVANLLAYKSLPGPPPAQGLQSSSRRPDMQAAAVPPPAAMQQQRLQSAPTMDARVIAPTENALDRQLTSRRTSSSRMDAVPPTVSAPQQVTILNPKLTLPESLVVPPAPSRLGRQSARSRLSSDEIRNEEVVPPSPHETKVATGREVPNVGNASVVAPPSPAIGTSSALRQPGNLGESAVVAPPSSVAGSSAVHRQADNLGDSSVVAPPSKIADVSYAHQGVAGLGNSPIVAPPTQLAKVSSSHRLAGGFGESKVIAPTAPATGSLMRSNDGMERGGSVVQPTPSSSGVANSNDRRGRGAPDTVAGAAIAPPSSASGIVLSARPGATLATPSAGSAGSLALSPSGGARPGLGGTGGGTGISNGKGPGSSMTGEGPGAKNSGSGPGSTETAHNGISPFPGAGGAGKGANGAPSLPGVSVSGGRENTIKLPSFGTDHAPGASPDHSPAINSAGGPGITVVATSHSGGAFNYYGALKGDRVYTIYIDTALGTAVMQFADPKSATEAYAEDLTAPQALRAELPPDVTASRLVISCVLDRTGLLKTPRVVEANSPELSAKVMAELPKWKFRPVFRGNQAIEVNAILGFDIDTR